MAKTPRISYHTSGGGQGLLNTSAAVIVPCGEAVGFPRAALQRAQLGDPWRSPTGWTIKANENDLVRVNRGGVKNALVAPGFYATGPLLATAIAAALQTADPTPVWSCNYDVTAGKKFTISTAAHNFTFDPAGQSTSMHIDIGFSGTTTASTLTHTADDVSYQSRQWFNVDLGSAQAATVAIARGHNVSTTGTIRVDGSVATFIGAGLDSAASDYTATLAGTSDPRIVFFASQSKRYLRGVVTDVQNPVGYAEVGIFFVGTYIEPAGALQNEGFAQQPQHLSDIVVAAGGAHQQVLRAERREWTMSWKIFSQADEDLFTALDAAMRVGGSFFLTFDSTGAPTTTTYYGFLRKGAGWDRKVGEVRVVAFEFSEAL